MSLDNATRKIAFLFTIQLDIAYILGTVLNLMLGPFTHATFIQLGFCCTSWQFFSRACDFESFEETICD